MTCGHLQHRLLPRLLKILFELLGHPTSKETLSSLTKSKDHMKRNIIYSCSKLDELYCDSKIEIEIVAVKICIELKKKKIGFFFHYNKITTSKFYQKKIFGIHKHSEYI
jgi:hypothetical protein